MFSRAVVFTLTSLAVIGCGGRSAGGTGNSGSNGSATATDASGGPPDSSATGQPMQGGAVTSDDSCLPGHELTGASTDVAGSKFAFGGTPVETDEGANKRWTGPEGQMLIMPFGEMASPDGGAASEAKADWSNDPVALTQHVTDYFVSRGVARCQIQNTQVDAGSQGRFILLIRAVDGIAIDSSSAFARFNVDDQASSETLAWPTIPAQVVSDARAFRDQLKDPTALAAYQAKLPATARGMGSVRILHSHPSATTFVAKVVWATTESSSPVTFDTDGNMVSQP